jgi:hypothetical protein
MAAVRHQDQGLAPGDTDWLNCILEAIESHLNVPAESVAEVPESTQIGYHGPTSVLYDQIVRNSMQDLGSTQHSEVIDEATKHALVAEASRQRRLASKIVLPDNLLEVLRWRPADHTDLPDLTGQLELINFSEDRLDFDGVDPRLGMQLLSLYWARQLHAAGIVYRPAFMRDMACGGQYFSKLLLNAMYYSVSKHSPDTSIRQDPADISTAGWSFRQRFTGLLHEVYHKSEITTIQALLVMASSLFTRCDERSTSWLYAGNAFNMIVDLGLHVPYSPTSQLTAEILEIRTRVFWAPLTVSIGVNSTNPPFANGVGTDIDKLQCLYQGRHPCLRLADSDTPLNLGDDYEELEKFDSDLFADSWHCGAIPSYNISIMMKLFELSVIMERIQTQIYSVARSSYTTDRLYHDSKILQLELETWRKRLPPQLDINNNTRPQQRCILPYNLAMLYVFSTFYGWNA